MDTAGIIINRNANGIPTFACIDLNMYGEELKEFFFSKGISIEKSTYDIDTSDEKMQRVNLSGDNKESYGLNGKQDTTMKKRGLVGIWKGQIKINCDIDNLFNFPI